MGIRALVFCPPRIKGKAMKNYHSNGRTLVLLAAAAIASGELVVVGQVAGVAVTSVAEGEEATLHTEGVFELPKAAAAIAQGAKVYWNATDKNVTATATGNTYIGLAWDAGGGTDTTVNVKLNA